MLCTCIAIVSIVKPKALLKNRESKTKSGFRLWCHWWKKAIKVMVAVKVEMPSQRVVS